jgi:signal transduction histidine kinase
MVMSMSEDSDRQIIVSVTDNGQGIDPEIFQGYLQNLLRNL